MENTTTAGGQSVPTAYDYRIYDRIWQRVSPDLNPYPDVRAAADAGDTAIPAPQEQVPAPAAPAVPVPAQEGGGEPELPGAERNPCCMGTEAQESLEVLEGFIEEELADRRYFLALSRQAPAWAEPERGEALPAHRRREAGRGTGAGQRILSDYRLLLHPRYFSGTFAVGGAGGGPAELLPPGSL